jgi:hypothetical protein
VPAQTRRKKITRGPRKGQTITVYAKSGSEVLVASGRGKNRQKGNPRAGKKFTRAIDSKGREVHIYAGGKRVTLKGRRARGVRFGQKPRGGFTVAQRQRAVRRGRR